MRQLQLYLIYRFEETGAHHAVDNDLVFKDKLRKYTFGI
jgi:hypothetical protein